MRAITIAILCAALLALVAGNARARHVASQSGLGGREIVEAVGRWATKKAVATGAREVLEEGTEIAARRLGSTLMREGGEELVERAARRAELLGAPFVRVLDDSPAPRKLLDAIDGLPAADRGRAVAALAREGRPLALATESVGREALEAELRHPGLGGEFIARLGDDGVEIAAKSSSDDLAILARHQDEIAALPSEAKSSVMANLKSNGAATAEWLRRNPKFVLTGATAGILVANSERVADGLMDAVTTGVGTVARISESAADRVLGWVLPILSVALVGWIGLRLWPRLRARRSGAA